MGIEYDFTIGGELSANHNLEYIVRWADGSDTGWTAFGAGVTSAEASHTWESAETFAIEVLGVFAARTTPICNPAPTVIPSRFPNRPRKPSPDPTSNTTAAIGMFTPDISYSFTLAASVQP